VRTGKAVSLITKALMTKVDYDDKIYITGPIPEYQLILPIPVGEIEKDPTLTQNSGY
jgi:starch-binding outer membrane protein, SusD/RagB family